MFLQSSSFLTFQIHIINKFVFHCNIHSSICYSSVKVLTLYQYLLPLLKNIFIEATDNKSLWIIYQIKIKKILRKKINNNMKNKNRNWYTYTHTYIYIYIHTHIYIHTCIHHTSIFNHYFSYIFMVINSSIVCLSLEIDLLEQFSSYISVIFESLIPL